MSEPKRGTSTTESASDDTHSSEDREIVSRLFRALGAVRNTNSASEMPLSTVLALLAVAEMPAQSIGELSNKISLSETGVHRILQALGAKDRRGNPGLGLIEEAIDPALRTRKLIFLTDAGRRKVGEIISEIKGNAHHDYIAPSAEQYIQSSGSTGAPRISINALASHEVANAKRALRNKGIHVGRHIVAFPLQPAICLVDEIKTWLLEHGGELHIIESVAKPAGAAIVNLPDDNLKLHFILRFRQ